METIHEIDTIKIEKAKAMRRYRTFRNIANIVRTLEVFVAVLLLLISISWTTSFVPTVLQFSGEFLRRVSSLLFSPLFVFVIGNVIIITLFLNSSNNESSGEYSPCNNVGLTEDIAVVDKVYRRSQSEVKAEVVTVEKAELRRSMTVPRRKTEVASEVRKMRKSKSKEDELSNEEFNRKVEEFIERQRMFLSEEETKALVLAN